jgi:hypothetical protein
VDDFGLIVGAGMGVLLVALLLIGRFYPGTGADVLDWKPTRSIEAEVELELDDIEQMLEAQNERRRRRGEPERTEDDVRAQVAADLKEAQRLRDDYLEQQDLDQLLATTNERRVTRGEPALSADELRAQLEADAS